MNSDLYLKHDLYTKDDDKIIELCNTTGAAGYGLYWATVEVLYSCDNHKISKKDLAKNLSRRFLMFDEDGCPRVPEEIGRFIEYISSSACSLFTFTDGVISNKRVNEVCKEHEEFLKKQSERGKKGMAKRWSGNNTGYNTGNSTVITKPITNKQDQEQEQDNKGKKEVVEEKKAATTTIEITLVDGSKWSVPEEFIYSKQKIYPELDARNVFLEIASSTEYIPSTRPMIQNINGSITRWFENKLKNLKAEKPRNKVGDQFNGLKEELESQKNADGGFDL